MNREKIREKTMQLIYQMDISSEFDIDKLKPMDEDASVISKKQAADTLDAVKCHIEEIDAMIKRNIENWSFDRIAKADLAIIRTAVAEMLYIDYIPAAVSINEAVKLSRLYGDEKSYKFVNSVLGKIERAIEEDKR